MSDCAFFKYGDQYFARCSHHIPDLKAMYNPVFFRTKLETITESEYLIGKLLES